MKKILNLILSFTLALTLALSAMGCSTITYLSFNSNFSGDSAGTGVSYGLTETLEYSVKLVENYNEQIIKSSEITDDLVKYEYSAGRYVQKLSVVSFLPDDKKSATDIELIGNIYRLQTELSIDVSYTFNDDKEPYNHTDTIVTDCYFLSSEHALAPLWSYSKVDNTYLLLSTSNNVAETTSGIYEYTTFYNQKSYTMKTVNLSGEEPIATEKTYTYDYKTAIDNNQLLFAMRNVSLEEEGKLNLPVVSPAYGQAKTLQVTYSDSSTLRKTVTYKDAKGQSTVDEIPVKNFNFIISATHNTGAYHYMKYQKTAVENLPFRSLLVEYAAPVISFSSYNCMGALVYELNSVIVENASI